MSNDDYTEALLRERQGYVNDDKPDRVKAVDAELKRRGYKGPKAPGAEKAVETPPEVDGDIDALRAEAEKAGVKVDGRWGADKLREEIAAAKKK